MSAETETLRDAAKWMRKRAERMPLPVRGYGMSSQWTTPTTMLSKVTNHGRVLMESRQNCDPYDGVYAADYFSSLHPAVILAVADWLDHAARRAAQRVPDVDERALAVARAYLASP